MGLDEVGTARTLREHRKVTDALVEKHGGRIVKTTGDGVPKKISAGNQTNSFHLRAADRALQDISRSRNAISA
jgi:class 3 adenylate cyclase